MNFKDTAPNGTSPNMTSTSSDINTAHNMKVKLHIYTSHIQKINMLNVLPTAYIHSNCRASIINIVHLQMKPMALNVEVKKITHYTLSLGLICSCTKVSTIQEMAFPLSGLGSYCFES